MGISLGIVPVMVPAHADVGAGREASQEECAQRSPSQSPAPHSLISSHLRASNKRELRHIAVVQPQRGPEMVVTHNFHLLRRILGRITLEHHPEGYPLKAGHQMPQWFQASQVVASSDGHSGCFGVTTVVSQLSRVKWIPLMHTGVVSSGVVWHVFSERYTRVLMDASPEFPIHFLKIYIIGLVWMARVFSCTIDFFI
jgi:hypothetical protein